MRNKKKRRQSASKLMPKKKAEQESPKHDSAHGSVHQKSYKLVFRILCRPHGSKLKKPNEFFSQFFANQTSCNAKIGFDQVQYLKDDVFLIQCSEAHEKAVRELNERGEIMFAAKNVKILSIEDTSSNLSSPVNAAERGATFVSDSDENNEVLDRLDSYIVDVDSEAERLVQKRDHVIDGSQLTAQFPCLSAGAREDDLKSRKLVEIHGDLDEIGEDTLLMFLESKKRSGGGDIESHDFSCKPANVTFSDIAAAERVVETQRHSIDGKEFLVRFPEISADNRSGYGNTAAEIANGRLVEIHGDLDEIGEDILLMFLESKKRSGGGDIESHDFSCRPANVTFSDIAAAGRVVARGDHTVNKAVFKAMRPVTGSQALFLPNTVVISNLSKDADPKHLKSYFERLGGRQPSHIQYSHDKTSAMITLPNETDLVKVLREHKICYSFGKTEFRIERLKECDSVFVSNIPKDTSLDHLKLKLERTAGLADDLQIVSHGDSFAIFKLRHPQDISDLISKDVQFQGQRLKVEKYFSKHIPEQIWRLTRKPPGVVLKEEVEDDRPGQEVSNADKTEAFESDFLEREIELPNEKISVLECGNFLEQMSSSRKLEVKKGDNKLIVKGSSQRIDELETKLALKVANIIECMESVSPSIYKMLQDGAGLQSVTSLMDESNLKVICSPDPIKTGAKFYSFSNKDLKRGIETFKERIVDLTVDLSKSDASLLENKPGKEVLDTICRSHVVFFDLTGMRLCFTAVDNRCFAAKKELQVFLDKHAYRKDSLTLTKGKAMALLSSFEEECHQLKINHQVSIDIVGHGLEIVGRGSSASKVCEELVALSGKISREIIVLQRPGLKKVMKTEAFKNFVTATEKNEKIVIIEREEDKVDIVSVEKGEQDSSIISQLLVCQMKLGRGKTLAVYQGDITEHKADAIVNPANQNLCLGGGVAGAVLSSGGDRIQAECDKFIQERGQLNEGDVATTSAGNLKFTKKVIHAFGPSWPIKLPQIGQQELEHRQNACREVLTNTINNVLREAEMQECASVAVPAISSGIFAFPKDLCAEILTKAAYKFLQASFGQLREVNFVNNDAKTVTCFHKVFLSLFKSGQGFEDRSKPQDSFHRRQIKPMEAPNVKKTVDLKVSKEQLPRSCQSIQLSNLEVKLNVGDLSEVKADVIVNSASPELDLSKNPCAKSLSIVAGKSLQRQCQDYVAKNGEVTEYQLVETNGGKLKCTWVFHAVCGAYQDTTSERKLAELIARILDEAAAKNATSIAMPALGTGMLNFPRDKVATIMLESVQRFSQRKAQDNPLKKIVFVAFHKDAEMIQALEKVFFSADPQSAKPLGDSVRVKKAAVDLDYAMPLDLEGFVIKLGGTVIEVDSGDITAERTDAIAVVGNKSLDFLGAVGEAIIQKEGDAFKKRARDEAPMKAGTTCLLKTQKLKAKYVAHLFPESASVRHMEEVVKDMFLVCERKQLESISLPAIGTGVFGKTPTDSACIILRAFADLCRKSSIKRIASLRIIIFDDKMVDPFKREMLKAAKSPEKYLDLQDGILLEWIKKGVSVVRGFFSTKEGKSSAEKQHIGKEPQWLPVTLHVYGKDAKSLKSIPKKVDSILKDHLSTTQIQKSNFAKLPKALIEEMRSYAARKDVLLDFEEDSGTMKINGFYKDTTHIVMYCYEMAVENENKEQKRRNEQKIASYVQWKEVGKDGAINYNPELNNMVEEAYSKKEKIKVIDMEVDGKISKFSINFEEKTVRNLESGEESELVRDELAKIQLPKEWQPMPKNTGGTEALFHVVTLSTSSEEYVEISQLFHATVPKTSVLDIKRIQNPHLFKSYMTRKESMKGASRDNLVNEARLFHGTTANTVEKIIETGFNRSFAGEHGVVYGDGVYFARDAKYSVNYAPADSVGKRHMFVAKVLAGNQCCGSKGMKVPQKGFDTAVDNVNNPQIHVVFYDNQCYPEFLITF